MGKNSRPLCAPTYDVLGRQTQDAVASFGTGMDTYIGTLQTAYDTGGRPYLFTSLKSSDGSVANQVQRTFNGLGQLLIEYQEHGGPVNTASSLKVQYVYAGLPGNANYSRLSKMIYPNGRVLWFGYNTTTTNPPDWAGVDNRISRVSFLADDNGQGQIGQHLEDLSYLGLDTVIKRAHTQPNVDLTYLASDGPGNGGDQYKGLDLFGRVVDQAWQVTNTTSYTDRFQYAYDRDGNRQYRTNVTPGAPSNLDELYHPSGVVDTFDANGNLLTTGYDRLNQLTNFERGQLDSTKTAIQALTQQHAQSWTLDALGNWSTFQSDMNAQNRGANNQNEITSISGQSTPGYDNNGNTTADENGKTLVFDAWNRFVEFRTAPRPSGTVLGSYAYDALGRRIQEPLDTTHARDLYFSGAWQVLEERENNNALVRSQNVWSPVYVDAMVLRDRDPNGTGTLSERLYVQQDANWNVTAVVNSSGAVQERYIYDPFGRFTDPTGQSTAVLDQNWQVKTQNFVNWVFLHQGGRYDTVASLYNFRNRDYSPTLGRWVQVDPSGYAAGDPSLYRALGNSPLNATDPAGLEYKPWAWHWHHLLPQAIFTDAFLEKHGLANVINIDDPAFGFMLRGNCHIGEGGIHPTGWNKDWADWIDKQGDKKITKRMIEKRLQDMMTSDKYKNFFNNPKIGRRAVKRFIRKPSLTKRLVKGIPFIGGIASLLGLASSLEAKGIGAGLFDAGMDAMPVVGAIKAAIEIVTGEDLLENQEDDDCSGGNMSGTPYGAIPIGSSGGGYGGLGGQGGGPPPATYGFPRTPWGFYPGLPPFYNPRTGESSNGGYGGSGGSGGSGAPWR